MTLRSCIPLFHRCTGWRLNVRRCVSLSVLRRGLFLCLFAFERTICEWICVRVRAGFSFCLPAPTAEKMATDVFFRDGSTIKEALVAFLMRHVNFIKCGVEESRSERLQLNVCLPLTLTRLCPCLSHFSSTYSLIGGSRPVKEHPTTGCDVRQNVGMSELHWRKEEKKKKPERESRCWNIRRHGQSK